jgi:hypothetical protein
MQAIEFETRIENGAILIPAQYQTAFGDRLQVKVILLRPELSPEDDLIAELLAHPLEIDNFLPTTRDELYDR